MLREHSKYIKRKYICYRHQVLCRILEWKVRFSCLNKKIKVILLQAHIQIMYVGILAKNSTNVCRALCRDFVWEPNVFHAHCYFGTWLLLSINPHTHWDCGPMTTIQLTRFYSKTADKMLLSVNNGSKIIPSVLVRYCREFLFHEIKAEHCLKKRISLPTFRF